MHRSNTILGVALLAGLGVLTAGGPSATQQSRNDEIAALRAQLVELTVRVARLEQATDSYYPAEGQPNAAVPIGQRTLIVDSIQLAEYVEDNREEIDQLKGEGAALERTLDQQRNKVADLEGRRGGRGGGNRNAGDRQVETQLSAQRRLLTQYQRELKRKKDELRRLEEAATAPRQIIVGRAGDVFIYLHTERDLSATLADIGVGDTITWRGRRIEMEPGQETWDVERVRKVG